MEFRNPPPTLTDRDHLIGLDADSQPLIQKYAWGRPRANGRRWPCSIIHLSSIPEPLPGNRIRSRQGTLWSCGHIPLRA